MQKLHQSLHRTEPDITLARVRQAQGDLERSLDALNQALNIPRQGYYIRLFLDEGKPMAKLVQAAVSKKIHPNVINHLLRIFDSVQENATITNQLLIEPLSKRELEVLQYLATGMRIRRSRLNYLSALLPSNGTRATSTAS